MPIVPPHNIFSLYNLTTRTLTQPSKSSLENFSYKQVVFGTVSGARIPKLYKDVQFTLCQDLLKDWIVWPTWNSSWPSWGIWTLCYQEKKGEWEILSHHLTFFNSLKEGACLNAYQAERCCKDAHYEIHTEVCYAGFRSLPIMNIPPF